MEEFDLSAFFITKQQANDFSIRLKTVIESMYQTGFDLENALTQSFGIINKDRFITFLRSSNAPTEIPELKKFLTAILEKLATLPTLSLTIAFVPSEKTLQTISQWFLLSMHKQILLDVAINPSLIAGAEINFNGKHMQFSVQSKFNEIIKKVLDEDTKPQPYSEKNTKNKQSEEFLTIGR